jgi:hypothetical protein
MGVGCRGGRSILEPPKVSGKSASRSVEADAARDIRTAECGCSVAKRELLPGDQAQHLAVILAQQSERTAEHWIRSDLRERADTVARFCGAPSLVGPPPCLRSLLVSERIACDRVQPGERFFRHTVELPPTDQEGFSDDIVD